MRRRGSVSERKGSGSEHMQTEPCKRTNLSLDQEARWILMYEREDPDQAGAPGSGQQQQATGDGQPATGEQA